MADKKRSAADDDDAQDEAERESFPASDPPAHSGITGVGGIPQPPQDPKRPPSNQRDDDARPKGLPNSDRHAAETAHSWEDGKKA